MNTKVLIERQPAKNKYSEVSIVPQTVIYLVTPNTFMPKSTTYFTGRALEIHIHISMFSSRNRWRRSTEKCVCWEIPRNAKYAGKS